MHHDAGAAEAVQQALDPRRQFRVGRILADGDAADPVVDGRDGRGAAEAVALAPADHALVGRDPHVDRLDMGARPPGEQRRLRPHVERNAELEGVDAFDGDGRHGGLGAAACRRLAIVADMMAACNPAFCSAALSAGGDRPRSPTPAAWRGGFVGGLAHPLFGPDHVLAMVAVGLWGAFLGAPAIFILPVVFPLVMAVGGVLGILGVPLPGVEIGIAVSAAVLGMMVALAARPPLWVAAVIVGAFAIFHGHAHGAELPPGADAVAYSAGFVIATGCLHLAGIALRPAGALADGADRGARGRRRHRHRRRDVSRPARMTGVCRRPADPLLVPTHCHGDGWRWAC